MNLVLDDSIEFTNHKTQNKIGMVVIRGLLVIVGSVSSHFIEYCWVGWSFRPVELLRSLVHLAVVGVSVGAGVAEAAVEDIGIGLGLGLGVSGPLAVVVVAAVGVGAVDAAVRQPGLGVGLGLRLGKRS